MLLEQGDCDELQIECADGTCIDALYQCDNVFDCPDRSDETPECSEFTASK